LSAAFEVAVDFDFEVETEFDIATAVTLQHERDARAYTLQPVAMVSSSV
jgi:hypothetical protein